MSEGIRISEEFFKKFGKKYPPESFLAREGEAGESMFLINSGKVAIIKDTPVGEKILATLKEGDFFGEMALMGAQPRRAASVKTITETTVLELNRPAFEALIKRSPEIAIKIIKTLTERVRDANGKLAALVHKSDFNRISAYISFLCQDRGIQKTKDQMGQIVLFKLEGISQALGVSASEIQRYLAVAQKARILGQNGDWLWVPYPQYLQPFGEFIAKNMTSS
jgi:CRP/FNR family transcriptional regulator, cyclic AMP receptor protein